MSSPGFRSQYATTMPFRRSAYGLIVESHEGRPTKIEGNPAHPSTLGASSSRMQASVLGLYDPDRSQAVALKGEKKSWADFVGRLEADLAAACGRRRRRLGDHLGVVLVADAGAAGHGSSGPLSQAAVGDLRRGQ